MYISGNVGIGISIPSEKLDIAGNAKISQTVFATDINSVNGTYSGFVKVDKDITTNRNIGIGVPAPVERLEVLGNIKATQYLLADGVNVGEGIFSRNVKVDQNVSVAGSVNIGNSLSVSSDISTLNDLAVGRNAFRIQQRKS